MKSIQIMSIALPLLFSMGVASMAQAQTEVTPAEARSIAKEAHVYANPLADNDRILYSSFVNRTDPEYKAPFNQIKNFARVYTPDEKAVQTPNSDTPIAGWR
ncbi:MAG: hypothetical protein LJE65_01230 [Desulfobacteraceae bacterium]|nr:hypothetical protein [Desulfobacteraceae bacterium]